MSHARQAVVSTVVTLVLWTFSIQAAGQTCANGYGPNLATVPGTISSGQGYPSQGATNAFDGGTGTVASMYSPGAALGQDFGPTPSEVRRVSVRGTVSYGFNAVLQHSDDAATWTNTEISVAVPPGTGAWQSYDAASHGAHRYWRFLDTGGYDYLQIDQIEMRACNGGGPPPAGCAALGANVASSLLTISAGTAYPGQGPANAFDGGNGTWASLYSPGAAVGQDFGTTPREIRHVRLRGTASHGFNSVFQYSDDGTNWTSTAVTTAIPPGSATWHELGVSASGPHRYWRFLDTGGFAFLQIDQIEMQECLGPITCGNGVQDAGEQCDGGGCCTTGCTFAGPSFVCRASAAPCDAAETCTGAAATCPGDTVSPLGMVCRPPAGTCDLAETCDGVSFACPADEVASAGTVCRPAFVSCDTAEVCAGGSASCPADQALQLPADRSSVAATISGGSAQPEYPTTNAFDNNLQTVLSMVSSPQTYIGQDFGTTPLRLGTVRIYRGSIGGYPFAARLQFSDDNTSWTTAAVPAFNVPVGEAQWRSFDVPDQGAHRYWRFADMGAGYLQVQEIELLEGTTCIDQIHAQSIVVLAHDHQFQPSDFADMHAGGMTAKVLKVTTDSKDWDPAARVRYDVPGLGGWTQRWLNYRAAVQAIADDPSANVTIIRTVTDIENAKNEGKVGVIFASEGAMPLEGDISRVQQLYDLGWRETQLNWSMTANHLVNGGQLTAFGRQVIEEMNRLGILMDVSHHSGALFDQEIQLTRGPVIRSHDTPSSLGIGGESTDAMIVAVANSGGGHGVFALHFYEDYLGGPASTNINTLVNAIDYVVNLVGVDHVALGGDYFPENRTWALPSVAHIKEITAELARRGYSCEAIRKILGLNLMRLYEQAWRPR